MGTKRPTRPKRSNSPLPKGTPDESSSPNFTYRGKGGKDRKKKKGSNPNPWAHAHDEYARKRTESNPNKAKMNRVIDDIEHKKSKKIKTPKGGRPVRIQFETEMEDDDSNHPEEKSNRPLSGDDKPK